MVLTVPEDEQRVEDLFRGEALLGYDSESRPAAGLARQRRAAVIQLATERAACLWRVGELGRVPPLLRRLLEDPSVHKVTQGAVHEVAALQEEWGVNAQSFIDLHHMALNLRTTPRSLQGLVALFMRKCLGKEERLSDWEQVPLTQAQIEYAAVDAWASREVLVAMRRSYSVQRLDCERLLGATAGPSGGLGPRLGAADGAPAVSGGLHAGVGDCAASADPPRASQADAAPTVREEAHQKLAALCVLQGYVLRFDGFESAPNGFRCVFKVEHRRGGRAIIETFKSKRVHSTIRAAQNDAAAEAVAWLTAPLASPSAMADPALAESAA